MRKLFAYILSVIMLLSYIPNVKATDEAIDIKSGVPKLTLTAQSDGAQATVSLNLADSGDIASGKIEISFDTNALSYFSYTIGEDIPGFYGIVNTDTTGKIILTFLGSGDGKLLDIVFNGVSGYSGITNVDVSAIELLESDEETNVAGEAICSGCEVNVSGDVTPTPTEPPTTPIPTPFVPSEEISLTSNARIAGNFIAVDVFISENSDAVNGKIRLSFNSSLLTYKSWEESFPALAQISSPTKSEVAVVFAGTTSIREEGKLFTVYFSYSNVYTGDIAVELICDEMSDFQGNDIIAKVTTVGCSISVEASQTVLVYSEARITDQDMLAINVYAEGIFEGLDIMKGQLSIGFNDLILDYSETEFSIVPDEATVYPTEDLVTISFEGENPLSGDGLLFTLLFDYNHDYSGTLDFTLNCSFTARDDAIVKTSVMGTSIRLYGSGELILSEKAYQNSRGIAVDVMLYNNSLVAGGIIIVSYDSSLLTYSGSSNQQCGLSVNTSEKNYLKLAFAGSNVLVEERLFTLIFTVNYEYYGTTGFGMQCIELVADDGTTIIIPDAVNGCSTAVFNIDYPIVSASNGSAAVEKNVEIVYSLEKNPGVSYLAFLLVYDDELIDYIDYNPLLSNAEYEIEKVDIGKLSVVLKFPAVYETDMDFITLRFTVAKKAPLTSVIELKAQNVSVLGEYNGNIVPADNVNGSITVVNSTGDVNSDGRASVMDAILILRKLAGWNVVVNDIGGDINGDNRITVADAVLLLRHLAGWSIPAFAD